MSNTLFLRLEGPLQSWGERARWSIRDTAPEPTKSGVIGLVACALGYADDERIRHLSSQTQMGVRVDSAGIRITDYHTIGGGYDTPFLLTAQGKPKKSSGKPHTEISWRDYLCDASFLVALQSEDEELIAQMGEALQNPVWTYYLGRKSCVPSVPIYAGISAKNHPNLLSALKTPHWSHSVIPLQPRSQPKTIPLRTLLECHPQESDSIQRRDHLHSRKFRIFHPRYVRQGKTLSATVSKEGKLSIDNKEILEP